MIGLFKDKSVVAVVALIFCTLLIHFHVFTTPVIIAPSSNCGVLNTLIQHYTTKITPAVLSIAYITILFVQAIRLNLIVNNSKMYLQQSFTPAFAYILLSGLLPNAYCISPAFIANSFILLLLSTIFKLYNNQQAKGVIFNVGFLTSIIVIGYYPAIVLVVVAMIGFAILRSFRANEWFILILGIIAPFYLLFGILYLCSFNFHQIILTKITLHINFDKKDFWTIANLTLIGTLIIAGIYTWLPNSNRLVIQIRKNWAVVIILFLATLIAITIYTKLGAMPNVICLIPMAIFIANFFIYPRNTLLANTLVFIAAILIVYNNGLIWK